MNDTLVQIGKTGIVPVVVLNNASDAEPLAEALINGGLPCAEVVSPGFNPKVVEYCLKNNYPITPGIMTPTELEMALGFGLDVVKFFPAENAGGLKMIKAMAAPYTMMKFMPTGGINATNVGDYLACDKILACGGSWMVKGDLIKAGKFDEIQKLTAEAAAIVKEIRG